ncbi:MAG TPA: type IV toxin-antitoxin system AbiEi family antitoxin domain-containing protein [Steroidobacteraceae bacterium]|nr:type IV toxin-antitoxin system AbiEi family antitoxin domain-containing protein [Steroidobacteraceae bacterium]
MGDSKNEKLNRLLETLGDTTLVSSRWLRAHGYPSNLVARYMAGGWLQSPTRGLYLRKGGKPTWEGLLRALQRLDQLPLHVGGRFALARQGHEHYLRLGESATLTLYGPAKLPAWASKLPLPERVQACGKGPFDWPALSFGADTLDGILNAQGLERATDDTSAAGVVFSTPERAILELCDETPDSALVHEVNALLQGLATLRPQLVSALLQHCGSIKAKRLFLALADRHRHAWLAHVSLQDVDLGSGKRVLVQGGKLNAKYQITLPADLDEQLG